MRMLLPALVLALLGTAADLIKLAMVAVQKFLDAQKLQSLLIMQVHDELVLEVEQSRVAEVEQAVRAHMAGAASLRVPLKVDVGQGANWDEAH